MSCQRESPRREFTPVLEPGREFNSSTKSRNENQRSGSDEKLSAHSDFSPDPELLTPTESRWGRRSFIFYRSDMLQFLHGFVHVF